MMRAGVPLIQAFDIVARGSSNPKMTRLLTDRLDRETQRLADLCARPVLADPLGALVTRPADQLLDVRRRCRVALAARLDRAGDDLGHVAARVRSLSPQSTLDRGYAVLTRVDGSLVTDPNHVDAGDALVARVAGGRLDVVAGRAARATVPGPAGG